MHGTAFRLCPILRRFAHPAASVLFWSVSPPSFRVEVLQRRIARLKRRIARLKRRMARLL